MDFTIQLTNQNEIQDAEISTLLNEVYVEGGYCTAEEAKTVFAPKAVKQRGQLLTAREPSSQQLVGMIIVVPHDSPSSKMAKEGECEMHLLGVANAYRGKQLGKQLVQTSIEFAKAQGHNKMILWTQAPMKTAQALYEKAGFAYQSNFEKNGRTFLLYEKALS